MVRLVPMDAADLPAYLELTEKRYAADSLRAGRGTPEQVAEQSRNEIHRLLPEGILSPNTQLFSIVAGEPEQKVGVLWFANEPRGGFVYDLYVDEPHRRKGYGGGALRELEKVVGGQGVSRIWLHVFGDNAGAVRLYEQLGYQVTDLMMAKSLPARTRESPKATPRKP